MEAGLEQILSPDEILQKGLELVGFSRRRQQLGLTPLALTLLTNHRGELRWEGSEAERLLRLDMDEGKHTTMTPFDLYCSRSEYSDHYPLKVSRKHIDQEERPRKMLAQYTTKKNKQS